MAPLGERLEKKEDFNEAKRIVRFLCYLPACYRIVTVKRE
ncbi:hypothetical protein ALT1545_230015 [Alteromonas macleodii]